MVARPAGGGARSRRLDESFRMHELQVTERILDVVLKHAAGHDVSKIMVHELTGMHKRESALCYDSPFCLGFFIFSMTILHT